MPCHMTLGLFGYVFWLGNTLTVFVVVTVCIEHAKRSSVCSCDLSCSIEENRLVCVLKAELFSIEIRLLVTCLCFGIVAPLMNFKHSTGNMWMRVHIDISLAS
ncbi:hypothetical protein AMECASPLE_024300 [Ameca splendens]|uniref:Uncharacterized protein n=1 Tax=Ameca splendens TaxID=208324 RepID=A0ABV0Y490_9TELE